MHALRLLLDTEVRFENFQVSTLYSILLVAEEYAQFYGAMNTMRHHEVTMRKDGLPYEDMGYVPPPNRSVATVFLREAEKKIWPCR